MNDHVQPPGDSASASGLPPDDEVLRALRVSGNADELEPEQRALALAVIGELRALGVDFDGIYSMLYAFVHLREELEKTSVTSFAPMCADPHSDEILAALKFIEARAPDLLTDSARALATHPHGVKFLIGSFGQQVVHAGKNSIARRGPKGDFAESVLALVIALHLEMKKGDRCDGLVARFLTEVAAVELPGCGRDSDLANAWRRRLDRAREDEIVRSRAEGLAKHFRLIP